MSNVAQVWTHFRARSCVKVSNALTTSVGLRRTVLAAQLTALWTLSGLGKHCVCRSYGPWVKAETLNHTVLLRHQRAEEGHLGGGECISKSVWTAIVNTSSKPASSRSEDSKYAILSPKRNPVVMLIVYIRT